MVRLYKTGLIFVIVIPVIALLYVITAGLLFHWPAVSVTAIVMFFLFYVMSSLGISGGFHRLATHQAFETKPWIRLMLWIMGNFAWEGGVIRWSSVHAKHHKYSDEENDPHSPLDGFVHAHFGWILDRVEAKPETYAKHLLKDPIARYADRTFILWSIVSILAPAWICGIVGFVYGGLHGFLIELFVGSLWAIIRIGYVHHITWSVNSYSHLFGKREFETNDNSHNSWWVGTFAGGEHHNNHHALPNTVNHGIYWWQIDFVYYFVCLLERLGFAWNLKRFTPERVKERKEFWKNWQEKQLVKKTTIELYS